MIPDVVYQHLDWVVLNKPAGVSVEDLSTLYKSHFLHFHPAHRLDKGTSGLWLVALNAQANRVLSQMFAARDVSKQYLALTTNKPKKKQGKLSGDMLKSRRGQWQLSKAQNNPAVTTFLSTSLSDGKRLFLCKPVTGKTHQIRVAMKANGAAILGDSYYAREQADQYDRLYLHAYRLAFNYNNEKFSFELLPETGKLFQGSDFIESVNKIAISER